MKQPVALLHTADYIRVIRPLLPREAFAPQPRHLVVIVAHFAVIACVYVALRFTDSGWLWPLIGLVIGHSIACLGFLAHDLSHGSIVRSRRVLRFVELLLWGINLTPATVWRRVHNGMHHHETNTVRDTDRLFRRCEKTPSVRLYTRVLVPHRGTVIGSPLVLTNFIAYVTRHVITAFLPGERRLTLVTAKPAYTSRDKRRIALELLFMGLLQIITWFAVGGGWRFVWASVFPIVIASSIVMTYIWTQHLLNPLCDHTDPLIGSTTVVVPRWLDWLHDHISHHTEHHVFPSMNPQFYPLVSELLQQYFPDRYNRLPLTEAWRRLWRLSGFIDEPAD